MSIVKINAIELPAERAGMMAQRFAARAGEVGNADGFEEFQLLRPDDERTTWLVYTRGRDEAAFDAWRSSQPFGQGGPHGGAPAQGGPPQGGPPQGGPLATGSELWSFLVEQREQAP